MDKTVIHKSQLIYRFLLKFYPKRYRQEFGEEMRYVFSQSLKDAYLENGKHGIINLWFRTIGDTGKSLISQHLEAQKGGVYMKSKGNDLIMQNKVFLWIAIAATVILSLPFMAMQFNWQVPDPGSSISSGVNWNLGDFLVMGTLLFGMGSLFVLVARRIDRKYRVIAAIAFMFALLYIWAELAVGIFTNIGS